MRTKTTFHGIEIIHPHSGEVSRAKIETLLIHHTNMYPTDGAKPENRSSRAKKAAEYIKEWEGDQVVLEDVNYKIRIDRINFSE